MSSLSKSNASQRESLINPLAKPRSPSSPQLTLGRLNAARQLARLAFWEIWFVSPRRLLALHLANWLLLGFRNFFATPEWLSNDKAAADSPHESPPPLVAALLLFVTEATASSTLWFLALLFASSQPPGGVTSRFCPNSTPPHPSPRCTAHLRFPLTGSCLFMESRENQGDLKLFFNACWLKSFSQLRSEWIGFSGSSLHGSKSLTAFIAYNAFIPLQQIAPPN